MKLWKAIGIFLSLLVSANSYAALTDNGVFTTDTNSQLDWLDLSATAGQSYNSALATLDPAEGWRYATNTEIESIFLSLFIGYSDTNSDGTSSSVNSLSSSTQNSDVIRFLDLFGITFATFGVSESLGYYLDENGILRVMGAQYNSWDNNSTVFGLSFSGGFVADRADGMGTFLVRSSVVPEPGSIALLGIGILSLFRIKNRKME